MATNIQPIPAFQAPWPKSLDPALKSTFEKVARLFQKALYYLFFPVTFVWSHLRDIVCRVIMPGMIHIAEEPQSYFGLAKLFARFALNPNAYKADLSEWGNALLAKHNGTRVHLQTPDHLAIEGAFFETKGADRVVMVAGGNGTQWETQERWIEILKPLGVSVMLLNPRGLGSSNAKRDPQGWALDFYTGCKYLIKEKGYDPNLVLPLGFSMGGATATRGAALVQEEYPEKNIPCMNLCSFSHLTKEVDAIMKGALGKAAYLGFRALRIDMPVKEKWDTLKGEKVVMYKPHDEVIPFKASMAKAIGDDNSARVIPFLNHRGHNAASTPEEIATIQHEVRRILGLRQPFFSSVTPLPAENE